MRCKFPVLPLLALAAIACQSSSNRDGDSTSSKETEGSTAPATTTTAPGPAAIAAQEGEEVVLLREQRRDALVDSYLAAGRTEVERDNFSKALESFAAALELDSSNAEVRSELRRVRALMGDAYATAAEYFQDDTDRIMIKRAQAFLRVEELVGDGNRALEQAEYDSAIQAYRKAEQILRFHPQIEQETLDLQLVQGRLENAINLRDEAERNAARTAQEEAEAARLAQEAAERERRVNKLRDYYELAQGHFASENYKRAENFCALILQEDPGNEAARSLMETARETRHYKSEETNRKHYREQWLRTFEDLDTMNVPQVEPLRFQLDRWKDVRQREPLTHGTIDPRSVESRSEVLSILEDVRYAPRFLGPDGEGSPLEDVASLLQSMTGVNFLISNAVRDELDEEETTILLDLPDRSVRKILDIIAETRETLRWKIENGVVMFVTSEELTGGQVLVTYSVQDLIHPIPDYPGREINISPSGGIVPPDEDFSERESNVVTSTMLEDLIRNNVATESWDNDPANSIRITEMGQLVVNQVPEVQQLIQRLLDDLREATGIMVDIQARFMKVEDNFLEDIGVDFRGLGAPGLGSNGNDFNDFGDSSSQNELGQGIGQDNTVGAFYSEGSDGDMRMRVEELYDLALGNDQALQGTGGLSFSWTFLNNMELELILRAVSKSERVELVTAPRILVHNTARANLSVLNQIAYVMDYDVEIAQAASIADPIVAVIQDGVILDVRPIVSADRRFITLELRPTIAELQRPIEERPTTLGTQNSVTIQLPEVEIQRVRTSIPIPDGGTVLLGGMKVSEKQDLRSGVPILNKIPLLSALFERKGNMISNRKLLILLKALIVIPEEKEPTAQQLGLGD